METIDTLDALHAHYDTPTAPSLNKVARALTPHYRTWIEAARFVVLTTVGPRRHRWQPAGRPRASGADRR